MSAVVTFSAFVVMMVAGSVRIKYEIAGKISFYCLICIPVNSWIKLDISFCKGYLSAAAYASADENINIVCAKKCSEGTVSLSVGTEDF